MAKYLKNVNPVEFVVFGKNDVAAFLADDTNHLVSVSSDSVSIKTDDGVVTGIFGDIIAKEASGKYYLISAEAFKTEYTLLSEGTAVNSVEIEAVQYTIDPLEIMKFAGSLATMADDSLVIETIEGKKFLRKGEYLIKGVDGTFYPMEQEEFEKTYKLNY